MCPLESRRLELIALAARIANVNAIAHVAQMSSCLWHVQITATSHTPQTIEKRS
jgi:hypothetical protein